MCVDLELRPLTVREKRSRKRRQKVKQVIRHVFESSKVPICYLALAGFLFLIVWVRSGEAVDRSPMRIRERAVAHQAIKEVSKTYPSVSRPSARQRLVEVSFIRMMEEAGFNYQRMPARLASNN